MKIRAQSEGNLPSLHLAAARAGRLLQMTERVAHHLAGKLLMMHVQCSPVVLWELRGFPPQGFPTVGKPFRRRFSSPTSGETQGSSVSNFKKC